MDWSKTLIEEKELTTTGETEGLGRKLSYVAAIREALELALTRDENVFIMGQGVDDPVGMFGITLDLHKKYGADRVFDTPLSENALTGIALGAALTGLRPVYMHNRPDFLLLAMALADMPSSSLRFLLLMCESQTGQCSLAFFSSVSFRLRSVISRPMPTMPTISPSFALTGASENAR